MLLRLFILSTGIVFGVILFLLPAHLAQAKRLYVNTNPLFEACLQRCEEQTPLGALTRRGCFKGCAEIRRSFGLSSSYRSMASCIEDLNDLELERDLVIEKHQRWCDKEWSHLHKRKGCKDAMEVYIRSATVNSICYHQTPEAIARQTPRATMGIRQYPTTTRHSPSSTGMLSDQNTGPGMGLGMDMTHSGNVLSMPPVYDTPKYRQTRPKATPRKTGSPSASTASSISGTTKAPALTPPRQTAKPAPKTSSQPVSQTPKATVKPVPVITPSTATASQGPQVPSPAASRDQPQAATPSTVRTDPAQTTGSVTPEPPQIPETPVGAGSPAPTASVLSDQSSQPAQTSQTAQTSAPQHRTTPSPDSTPLVNAATEPVSPPVITAPIPILPDLSATSPQPTVPTAPAASQYPASQLPATAGKGAGLLPSLQPASGQAGSGQTKSAPTATMEKTDGTDTPTPPPLPAPMP